MAPGGGEDLTSVEPRFEPAWRGFHRGQVKEFVVWAQDELRRMAAQRDAAMRRVAHLAEQNRDLSATIDRISRTPIRPDALQERSRRMIELTREEASEIIAQAKEKAEQTRLDAEAEAVRLTEKERALVAATEEDRRRRRAEYEEFMRRAAAERAQADGVAAQRRRLLEEDLTRALNKRRTDTIAELDERRVTTMAALDELTSAAEAEAEALVRNAIANAETLVRTARADAEKLLRTAEDKADTLVRTSTAEAENRVRDAKAHAAALVRDATAEAETRVRRATDYATRVVTDADDRVAELTAEHHRLKTALSGCREILARASAALDPTDEDADTPVPVQRRKPTLTEAPAPG
ncbi:M protein [Amycolatopsis sp. FDAARGOS 1241]|uniref:M protein n=1 Tax=Amycolatopsis sp. FDAARGOS 1241 TaxID=2778070 RepID=UPI00195069A9|nr:M protein [Amycolatopsis sp. FDAARGOS 1241]QRP48173.1 M protein [Amycolatopsis sp. FDAARGOS 1241]